MSQGTNSTRKRPFDHSRSHLLLWAECLHWACLDWSRRTLASVGASTSYTLISAWLMNESVLVCRPLNDCAENKWIKKMARQQVSGHDLACAKNWSLDGSYCWSEIFVSVWLWVFFLQVSNLSFFLWLAVPSAGSGMNSLDGLIGAEEKVINSKSKINENVVRPPACLERHTRFTDLLRTLCQLLMPTVNYIS